MGDEEIDESLDFMNTNYSRMEGDQSLAFDAFERKIQLKEQKKKLKKEEKKREKKEKKKEKKEKKKEKKEKKKEKKSKEGTLKLKTDKSKKRKHEDTNIDSNNPNPNQTAPDNTNKKQRTDTEPTAPATATTTTPATTTTATTTPANEPSDPPKETQEQLERMSWMVSAPKRETPLPRSITDILQPKEVSQDIAPGLNLRSDDKDAASSIYVGDGGANWRAKARRLSGRDSFGEAASSAAKPNPPSRKTSEDFDNRRGWKKRSLSQPKIPDRDEERREERSSGNARPRTPIVSRTSSLLRGERGTERAGEKEEDLSDGTPVDLNELAAEAIRAEISGDTERFNLIKKKLEKAKAGKSVVQLPDIDSQGRSRSALKKMVEEEKKEGKSADVGTEMQKLLKREKSGVSDFDADVARTIVKNKRYKEETENDQFDDEPGGPKTSKKSRKRQLSHENSLRKQAIKDYHKQNEKEKSCYYCFSNKKIPKHLIMSLGNTTYLMLPPKPLCEGHAWIVPLLHHTGGMVSMEEDVWEEVEKFMKCLTKMNYKQKKGTVFFETVVHLKSEPHSIIECVPLSEAEAANGPIYFKKAILEEGSHWAQHAKLIDTTGKGIRKSIPPHQFPYFYVQFGMTQGMAHIIEKEHKFKSSFGLEVLAGITDNDSYFTEGRQSRSKLDEIESTKSFLKNWMPFDWTTELDGGEI